MKTTVVITKTNGQSKSQMKSFGTEKQARNYFNQKCDELGYAINGDEAGGIGHDYLIELQ